MVISLVRRVLRHPGYGMTLLEDGKTETARGVSVDASTLPDEPVVREHVRRLQLALDEDDPALLLGSRKELLESTAKIVLARVGEAPPTTYPALVTRALEVLMLHPKSAPEQREDVMSPSARSSAEPSRSRWRSTSFGGSEAPVTAKRWRQYF
ncbi:MAG: hypothetical protein OXM54_10710 [Acidimicrobiaceae bacterium]|nr:hypothetical protein [Acidimicrobiaceae bacterium]